MAKKTFDNLNPRKPIQKPSDEDINKALNELEKEKPKKVKDIGFHVKLPENIYNALDAKSQSTGIPKKYILINALNSYLSDTTK